MLVQQRGSRDTCISCPLSSLPESSDETVISVPPSPNHKGRLASIRARSLGCPPACWHPGTGGEGRGGNV